MKTVLIAGAGQLGSRHLQGVKQSVNALDIWVYDLSEESLRIAEERYNQVYSENKKVHFINSLDFVPINIDIVIVASSSKPRATIIKNILASKNVKYMVLEKFLFTRLAEYQEIAELITLKNVKTWVNCPRRMWEGYSLISKYIDRDKPLSFNYVNTNWGLCCNTVHYLDIFMWLNGCKKIYLDIHGILPEVVDSKRNGYVEVNGTEKFTTENGSILTLTSLLEDVKNPIVKIQNGNVHIEYDESSGRVTINEAEYCVEVHYQSALSGILIDEIIEKGTCRLSTYEESSLYHTIYLSKLAPFINKIKGWETDSCPIT